MADAARLDFLWTASHTLLAPCPAASSYYMSQFLSLASDRELRLHEDIQTRSCAGCGTIFVPGLNSKVRVVPVQETRAEKEKRKRAARKRAKADKKKGIPPKISENTLEMVKSATTSIPKTPKQTIHITPYTEIAQQQQQQRKQLTGGQTEGKRKKAEGRANQLLNHIHYSCSRCGRKTELPGTKQGYLNSRIKPVKPVSQRRKLKKLAAEAQKEPEPCLLQPTLQPSLMGMVDSSEPTPDAATKSPSLTTANQKSHLKRPNPFASLPASPVRGLSLASSAATSAASSPAASPRLGGPAATEKNNRKKKKTSLASLLASQKARDAPPSDPSAGSGGAGDSALASFLMGL